MFSRCSLRFRSHLYRYLNTHTHIAKEKTHNCPKLAEAAFAFSLFIFHLIRIKCAPRAAILRSPLAFGRRLGMPTCGLYRRTISGHCRFSLKFDRSNVWDVHEIRTRLLETNKSIFIIYCVTNIGQTKFLPNNSQAKI